MRKRERERKRKRQRAKETEWEIIEQKRTAQKCLKLNLIRMENKIALRLN